MSVKEYFYDLKWAPHGDSRDDRDRIQEAALGFLLRRSETLELTAYPRRTRLSLGSFVFQTYTPDEERDAELTKTKAGLAPFLLKKVTDNRKHGLVQGPHAVFHHYFYRLTPELCSILVDAGLIWDRPPELAGFEDPTFYRPQGTLLARVVTREQYFSFFLSSEELIDLEKRGIALSLKTKHY